MLKRILYFVYYLKQLDSKKLKLFQQYVKSQTGRSKLMQWCDVFINSIKYNISILEYYQFRFWEKNPAEKKKWAGTGYMYEFQKLMNPIQARDILDDKRLFFKNYHKFFAHKVYTTHELMDNQELVHELYQSQKLVFKYADGKCGLGVEIIEAHKIPKDGIINFMKDGGYDLVETFVVQHHDLNRLSPSAVNTVRIFTQLNKENEVELLGCRQRISINSMVDNMAAGNIAAPINEDSGIIEGPGVYSDITKTPETIHPITGVSIVGFQVPFWKECVELAKNAALEHPQNRSIGWDIVVTENGPGLIEGNHDWCKLVWQLPVNQGLKHLLQKHV